MTKAGTNHRHEHFSIQLENLRKDADAIAQYLYSGIAVDFAAAKSTKLLGQLNRTPLFWRTHLAATQTAAYIGLARVLGRSSLYNVERLLQSFENGLSEFSRESLALRKRGGLSSDPDWLKSYLDSAYYPTMSDVARLRKRVADQRKVYERMIEPVRNGYLAHRRKTASDEVSKLYATGKINELWKMATFLLALHDSLWNLYHNGRKPLIRQTRYSIRSLYRTHNNRGATHERIVGEVRDLMSLLEQAGQSQV